MRIKGTALERASDKDFYVVKESNGRYAIHTDITREEYKSFLTVNGPCTYDEAIEWMKEAVSGEWDDEGR